MCWREEIGGRKPCGVVLVLHSATNQMWPWASVLQFFLSVQWLNDTISKFWNWDLWIYKKLMIHCPKDWPNFCGFFAYVFSGARVSEDFQEETTTTNLKSDRISTTQSMVCRPVAQDSLRILLNIKILRSHCRLSKKESLGRSSGICFYKPSSFFECMQKFKKHLIVRCYSPT